MNSNYSQKKSYHYSKPEIKRTFSSVNSSYLWILKPAFYNRVYFGSLSNHLKYSREMLEFEFQAFLPLVFITIILGLFPNIVLEFMILSSFINISL